MYQQLIGLYQAVQTGQMSADTRDIKFLLEQIDQQWLILPAAREHQLLTFFDEELSGELPQHVHFVNHLADVLAVVF